MTITITKILKVTTKEILLLDKLIDFCFPSDVTIDPDKL